MGSVPVFVTVLFCLSSLPWASSSCPILSRFPTCKSHQILARTKDANGCEQFECLDCPLPRMGCPTNEEWLPTEQVGIDECPEFQCGRCHTVRTAPRPKNCSFSNLKLEKDFNGCWSFKCKDEGKKPIWN